MQSQILELHSRDWRLDPADQGAADAIGALEAGKVLYFPAMPFMLHQREERFLTSGLLDPKRRNISLDTQGRLKGMLGSGQEQGEVAAMIARFRAQASGLVASIAPHYMAALRTAPTSYRPAKVEFRKQSWRADDRRLHVDAFPSRPNYGERILRVFTNLNPDGEARVWRVGESFPQVAARFVPRAQPYRRWQAKMLEALHVTKSLRSEYDHLMLQIHDGMKADLDYQKNAPQVSMPFPPGAVWVCFSDQTSHAVMSGQFMMEQTFHLPAVCQYDQQAHPLAILERLTGRALA